MPCVTAAAADIETLMRQVEQDAGLLLGLDLSRMVMKGGDREMNVTLPAPARDAFLNGSWDATGLLLDRFDEVVRVARRLPYVAGWER
jgi:3-isopropylmalate dehydratase small subunit